MLTFADVTLSRGPRTLLTGVSFAAFAGWRLGVVGRNGTGKTSLFGLVTGEIAPDAGSVALPRNLAVASVAQETPASPRSALDYALDGDTELRATEAELAAAEAAHDAGRIAQLHEKLYAIDGYAARARAARLLHGLGFEAADQERAVAEFSGGWRMRLNLARALLCRSDLLLLDEPTNHLDLDAVLWLQAWLTAYPGTMLVISHDRDFLDAVTTHTLHLAQGTATLYTGNYSQFERLRAERMAQQGALRAQQQRQIAHLQSFVDRFKAKASKARQAQARVKMIERIRLAAPAHADAEFEFSIPEPQRLPEPLLVLDRAAAGYGARSVLSGLRMTIAPGDRIGILGPNGAGKSTLTKLLAGVLEPQAGSVVRSPWLVVGYFAQHQLEQLDAAASPLEHLRRQAPGLGEKACREYLAAYHFRGDRVFEPVGPFSGGEKARLALALLVQGRPNLLLLDEPTNHLDLDLRHALEIALQDYAGALVLVSHDRHLVESTCDSLWRVAGGSAQPFDGDLDDYARWLAQRERDYEPEEAAAAVAPREIRLSPKEQRRAAAEQRARLKALRDAVRKAEGEMQRLGARLAAVEKELADPGSYQALGRERLTELSREQKQLRAQLAGTEDAWLRATTELENGEKGASGKGAGKGA
ncbi:MAG: ABC transporter ATP-binding protein [Gammaproteobacteria bacterium]|nr:ATP-binding cassette domain-containing protein [Gammaproteobacteria bacterium PRO8]MDL1880831.1 ATP-binding cassette domain-containing protein [Gammaproteobacteria bacterium PRO2]GIK36021.1 MAG: ABC transporter ATP-binding protein [Gammaproteobacteria bacterium]